MLIFTLIPIAIIWIKKYKLLVKNLKIITYTVLIGFFITVFMNIVANFWKAWLFNPEKILNTFVINFPVEDLFYILLVYIAIVSGTLAIMDSLKHGILSKL